MNNKIYELGCKTGLLNYIEHETPRVYFIDAHADLEEFDAFCNALTKERDDEIDRLRNLYKETCEEKNEEIFEWIEHSKQIVLVSQQWQVENARLRAILRWLVDTDPTVFRSADVHTDCKCHRCAMDAARSELRRDFGEKSNENSTHN